MVVIELPDGTTCEYGLRPSERGLRLVQSCTSYDLLVMLREAGWRIQAVKGETDRLRLRREFGVRGHSATGVPPEASSLRPH